MQQAEQLKINVSNIRSSLLIGTKRTQVLKIRKEKLLEDIEQKKLIQQEEKNLEQTKKPKKISVLKSPVKKVMSVFDNIMKFGTIVLTGILLNALPKMIDTIQKVFRSISNFFTRVFNFFKPFVEFVTGIEFDDKDSEYKKLMDDAENLKKEMKPLDEMAEKVKKIKGDFDKAAEDAGVSSGGANTGGGDGEETEKKVVETTEVTNDATKNEITPSDTTSENQSNEVDYRKLLDDALVRRAEYIQSGNTTKLVNVNKKIEFYEKKLGINSNSKFTILVKDSQGKFQKIDGSQLKSKNDNTISMLNNSGTSGSKTIVYQRQVVQTNIAIPV
tara:strand:- start:240 stop:1229 length:990 start_codon:yes stop_codon:yes gene_type:complete